MSEHKHNFVPRHLTTSSTEDWKTQHLRAPQAGAPMPSNLTPRQRRIIYRSRQRGWLELDILFGGWAAKHVPSLHSEKDVAMVEALLDADTPDVLKWILGQEKPPPAHDNAILASMREYADGDGHVLER